ncbi:hypothetical protein Ddye_025787 [Dipteronia dyeriana]|uniref:Cytochrome P450 n=1 Tax=Dipteronia dyeriana TaxID=168575 RepID=A0AAD9TLI5_9ROSI|nr:hypothetical protein Ddye_025787 [Dipteronia dyeriana]
MACNRQPQPQWATPSPITSQTSTKICPIMQLTFGSFPVVVASSAEMAKQFLKTHDHVFASRPQTATGKYTTYNYLNITWALYGPYWHQGQLRAFFSRLLALSGKPVLLKEHLSRITLSIISRIMLGKKYFSESKFETAVVTLEEVKEMLDELFLLNGLLNIGDWIPWLGFMDLQGYVKRMKALKKKFDRFHDHVFAELKAKMKGLMEDFVPKDMVDLLLQLAEDPNLEVKFNYDSDRGFTRDLIAGCTDTSATTVEWAMSEVMKQPHLIEKATEELDRVIGRQRWAEEKDIPELPYIDAIMKETMRKHPVAVLLAPHLAQEDCNVSGYDIRKGTRVFINIWSIGRDASFWDEPEAFHPERFLQGKVNMDVKGQSFELLPFGSGRRMCPGYSLGLKMIRSSLDNMLHGFHWKLPEDHEG